MNISISLELFAVTCYNHDNVYLSAKRNYLTNHPLNISCSFSYYDYRMSFVCTLQSNIGLILHAVGEYDLSLKFLQKALDLNTR